MSLSLVSFRNLVLRRVFHSAQYVYRTWFRSTPLVYRIPFIRTFMRVLSPPLSHAEIETAQLSLREDIVYKQVAELKGKGITTIHFYIFRAELLGDIISCEPICHYLKQLSASSRITWIVKSKFVEILKFFPLVDNVITVEALSEGYDFIEKVSREQGVVIVNCSFDNTQCLASNRTLRNPRNPQITPQTYYAFGNLLESYCLAAGLPRLQMAPVLTSYTMGCDETLPENYVVFHCHCSDSMRDWTDRKWNELYKELHELNLAIVEIGFLRTIHSKASGFYDRTGRLDLKQIAAIVRGATIFVGIDSAFGHMANAYSVPSVILLGRYTFFDSYFPYSGDFAHSSYFKCVRAKHGKYVNTISVAEVRKAVLTLCQSDDIND